MRPKDWRAAKGRALLTGGNATHAVYLLAADLDAADIGVLEASENRSKLVQDLGAMHHMG